VVIGLLALSVPPVGGAPVEEHSVKAAFLYNFAKFIAWPEQAGFSERQRFVFCLLGEDATGAALPDLVRDKTLHGYPAEVRRLGTLAEPGACDVLYLAGPDGDRIDAALRQLERRPVLTVSAIAGFARRGGMIELFVEAGRVRFAVNVQTMRAAALEPGSKLLALARLVGGGTEVTP
jgi:hypothetical protein